MKPILLICTFLLILFGICCEKEPVKENKEPQIINLPLKGGEIIAQSNSFGIELFKKTSILDDKNLLISPLSASAALTMLLNGCGNQTYDQIQQMLGFENLPFGDINNVYKSLVAQLLNADPEVRLALANAVWYRQNFVVKVPFLDTMNSAFSAHVEALDFSLPLALSTINGWANDNTFGKIPKVLNEVSDDAVMFLMNALYFKGTWTYRFEEQNTYSQPFYVTSDQEVNVATMHGKFPVKTYHGNDFSALELPYGRKNFSMVIILPQNSINDFIAGFDASRWNLITADFDSNENSMELDISLPKFKFEYEKILNDKLIEMGMTDAFIPYQADLSGISDEDIFVSFVKQNNFIEVNEEGTEAAAVTTIGIEVTSMPEGFYVNKPFLFAIREQTTNTILFIGKVVVPEY